jgi:hypothetical protein
MVESPTSIKSIHQERLRRNTNFMSRYGQQLSRNTKENTKTVELIAEK